MVSKILGGSLDPQPPLNEAYEWGSTLSPFLFALQLFRTATSCHGKRGCYTPAKMLLMHTIA